MPQVWLYDLTLTLRGYSPGRNAWDLEGHYTVAAIGNIREVQERVRDVAFNHFQRSVRRYYGGMYVARGEIKGRFQRPQPALKPSKFLHVELVEMVYRGRQHYPHTIASENLRFFRYDPEPYPPDEPSEDDGTDGYAEDAELDQQSIEWEDDPTEFDDEDEQATEDDYYDPYDD